MMQTAPNRPRPTAPPVRWEWLRTALMVPVFTGLIWYTANQSVGEARRFAIRLRVAAAPGFSAALQSPPEYSIVLRGPNRLLDRIDARLTTVGDVLDYRLLPKDAEGGPLLERDAREVLARTTLLDGFGLMVDSVEPPSVVIRVEPLATAELLIEPVFGAIEVTGPSVAPPRVTVEGPASVVQKLGGKAPLAAEPLLRSWTDSHPGASDFVITAPVEAAGASRINPARVTITGRVVGLLDTKQIGPVQILPGVPPSLQARFLVEPADGEDLRTDLHVRGPKDRLATLDAAMVQAYFDVKTADEAIVGQTIRRRIVVVLPAGVELVGEPPDVSFQLTPRNGADKVAAP